MQLGRSVMHRWAFSLFGLFVGVISAGSPLSGATDPKTPPAPRSRVYRLKHLDSTAAKRLVSELNLVGELTVLGKKAVIFTSTDSAELRTASAAFQVADSAKPYTITAIDAPSATLEAFENDAGVVIAGCDIGTFDEPPVITSQNPAIVGVRNGQLLVIAPRDASPGIVEAVRKKVVALNQALAPAPPVTTAEASQATAESATKEGPATVAQPPVVELAGPPAPSADELARRAAEAKDQPAEAVQEPAATKPQPATAGATELLQAAPTEQSDQPAAPAETQSTAPDVGEEKVDQAIARAVEAEKKAAQAELEAAEAEKKAKQIDSALAELMALAAQEAPKQQPPANQQAPSQQEPPAAQKPATQKGSEAVPKGTTDAKTTSAKPTAPAEPKPTTAEPVRTATATKPGGTTPAAKAPTQGPGPAAKAPGTPAETAETKEAAKPVSTPEGEPPAGGTKALTPEQMKQIEAEGQAGLAKLLELVQAEAARSQAATEATETTQAEPTQTPPTPRPPQPKVPVKTPIQPGTQAGVGSTTKPTTPATPSETVEPAKTTGGPTETSAAAPSVPPSPDEAYLDRLNIPNAEKELETIVTVPEQIEIMALIELVGKELGLNYIYDPTQVKGTVMLKVHDGKIKVKDMYAMLESVLKFKGLVMVRRGNLVTIVREAEALKYDPAIVTPDHPIRPGDVIVTAIFKLENISTQTAETMLKSMQLGQGFNSIPETQTLIVTDYAYRMPRIQEIIKLVDVTGQQRRIVSRTLKYTVASKLAPKVERLAGYLDTVQVTVSTTQPTTRTPTTTRTSSRTTTTRTPTIRPPTTTSTTKPQTADTVRLDTDDRTNRIFIIGLEDKVKIVENLIDQLDVPGQSLRTLKEYKIQYIETAEVVDALYELGVIKTRPATPSPTSRTTTPSRTTTTSRTTTSRTTTVRPPTTTSSAQTAEPDDPYISVRESTNSLLVNGTEEQHAEIAMVIAHIDIEQTDSRTIKEYEIQHVDAAEVVTTLEELGIVQPQGRTATGSYSRTTSPTSRTTTSRTTTARPTTPGATTPTPPPAAVTGGPTTAEDITAEYPQIAILEATNSLLVSATPRQHAAIALIISHVDRELDEISTPFVVYPLENQDPEELAATLGELVNAQLRSQAGTAGAAGAAGTAGARDTKIQTRATPGGGGRRSDDFDITIVPDKATYSLVVYANKKNQQWISELIKELDNYRPQVLLDVTLVEITKQDDFSYDLNVLSSIPDMAYTSGLTGSIIEGTTSGDILSLLSAAPDRSEFIDLQSDSGSFTGFYGDNKIQALFTAIQTKNYGRILAKPKLLVDDNQEGTIETRTTTYITRTRSSTQVPDTGAPFTTTDTTFEPYDASITLGIKPHISQGDNLRLEITLSRSDFLNFDSSSDKPPDQAVSDVQTVVTVPDNSTIILGGMDKINQSKGGSKVPILGDIPLLGGLFRSTGNTSSQSKLYIFIKAHILRPGNQAEGREDLVEISRINRERFEKAEDEMQKYEDWPGIKPKPMDPLRVLEEDFRSVGEAVLPGGSEAESTPKQPKVRVVVPSGQMP